MTTFFIGILMVFGLICWFFTWAIMKAKVNFPHAPGLLLTLITIGAISFAVGFINLANIKSSSVDQPPPLAKISSFEEEPLLVVENPDPQGDTQLEVCIVENKLGVRFGVIVASSLQVKKGDKLKVWNLEVPQTISRGGSVTHIAYLYVGSKE